MVIVTAIMELHGRAEDQIHKSHNNATAAATGIGPGWQTQGTPGMKMAAENTSKIDGHKSQM